MRIEKFARRLEAALLPVDGVTEMSGPAFMIFAIQVDRFCQETDVDVVDLTLSQVASLLEISRFRYEEICRGGLA